MYKQNTTHVMSGTTERIAMANSFLKDHRRCLYNGLEKNAVGFVLLNPKTRCFQVLQYSL